MSLILQGMAAGSIKPQADLIVILEVAISMSDADAHLVDGIACMCALVCVGGCVGGRHKDRLVEAIKMPLKLPA